MSERERRSLNSNSRNRKKGPIAQYEEYMSGSGGQTDESVLQYTSRSYEELRARDEELFYKEDEGWTFITEEEYQARAKEAENLSSTEEAQINAVLAAGIPTAIAATYAPIIGSKAIWETFGVVVARQFGQKAAVALGLAVGDGPSPVGDAIAAGLLVVTAWQITRAWNQLWEQVEQELANSEIVVTVEPENQVYTTPTEEQRGIEHTGSVPPQVETGTPGFDTDSQIETSNNTGGQTRVEQNASDYVLESRRRNVEGHDAEGGHTDERHIGKADQWLRNRQRGDGIKDSSSFTNNAVANLTQARFVKAYKKEIREWLNNKEITAVFTRVISMDRVIGTAIPGKGKARPTNKARIVLAKDRSELGYHVVTSFPIP